MNQHPEATHFKRSLGRGAKYALPWAGVVFRSSSVAYANRDDLLTGAGEIERFQERLAEVVNPEAIPAWLEKPNPAFDGLKPLEVIERGAIDRLLEYDLLPGIRRGWLTSAPGAFLCSLALVRFSASHQTRTSNLSRGRVACKPLPQSACGCMACTESGGKNQALAQRHVCCKASVVPPVRMQVIAATPCVPRRDIGLRNGQVYSKGLVTP
jgi:Protein of unknown function (DUF2384)